LFLIIDDTNITFILDVKKEYADSAIPFVDIIKSLKGHLFFTESEQEILNYPEYPRIASEVASLVNEIMLESEQGIYYFFVCFFSV